MQTSLELVALVDGGSSGWVDRVVLRLEWLISISSESAGALLIAIDRCVVYEVERGSNNERSINHPIFSSPLSRKLRIS